MFKFFMGRKFKMAAQYKVELKEKSVAILIFCQNVKQFAFEA